MSSKISIVAIALIFLSATYSFSQKKEAVFISDIIEEAFFSREDTITVRDKIISQANYINEKIQSYMHYYDYEKRDSLFLFLKSKYKSNSEFIKEGKIDLSKKTLRFINCELKDRIYLGKVNLYTLLFENGISNYFYFSNCIIKSIYSIQINSSDLPVNSTIWTDITFKNSQVESIELHESNRCQISIDSSYLSKFWFWNAADSRFWISNTEIKSKPLNNDPNSVNDPGGFLISTYEAKSGMLVMNNVSLAHKFTPFANPTDTTLIPAVVAATLSEILISNSNFGTGLKFSGSSSSRFSIVNSKMKVLSFHQFDFPQNNDIRLKWDQISGYKLTIPQDDFDLYIENPYNGNIGSLDSLKSYDDLMYLYKRILDIYQLRGDLTSYNACFAEIKDLQTKMAYHIFVRDKGFNNYFRWKLGELMKFYTNHGTDPARAIVISIWVIFLFGIFYFFFPSDWDVTSKSKLIKNFKDFSEKNEKGYVKPFFVLILGFLVSLINAMTLSLNAFVTLGFGNIPTHGIARYVCVIQGFIGWFLLSVFTVALINQVLG